MKYPTPATDAVAARMYSHAGASDHGQAEKADLLYALRQVIDAIDGSESQVSEALLLMAKVVRVKCPESVERTDALDLMGRAFVGLLDLRSTVAVYADHACAKALAAVSAPSLIGRVAKDPDEKTQGVRFTYVPRC